MKNQTNKLIIWTPRILAILFVLFLALFSLDIFDGNYGFWGTVLGLFMHNIPSLVLLVIVVISWKYEIVGGVAFIAAGLLYIGSVAYAAITNGFEWYYLAWSIQIAGPAFLVGILYLLGWRQKRKSVN